MSFDQFQDMVRVSLSDWETNLDFCPQEDESITVSLNIWGHPISDDFLAHRGVYTAELGGGLNVDSPLSVWQWVAMRLADQLDSTKSKPC